MGYQFEVRNLGLKDMNIEGSIVILILALQLSLNVRSNKRREENKY
jgi:hypothetical protein